jgi:hypothetical protein
MVPALTLLTLALAACTAAAQAWSDPTTLAKIGPQKLTVDLTYTLGGVAGPASCNQTTLNAPCLTKLQAGEQDEVVQVSYALRPGFDVNSTAYVQLKACYSPYSQYDRPWRRANPIIAKDRACAFPIKSNLPPSQGSATYYAHEEVPHSTLFVRAYVMCPASAPGAPAGIPANAHWPCAYGQSQTYFQVQPINSRPSSLVGGAIGCIIAGPVLLAALIFLDRKVLKRNS